MTVTTQTAKVTATGNGSATTFSFSPIVIFASTDLEVVTTLLSTGAETSRSEGTGDSAWSLGITTFPATGSITYPQDEVAPLESTHSITVKRVLTLEQQTDLNNQGGYFPDIQETQFDKLVMIDLQQQELLDRSLKVKISETTMTDLEIPATAGGSAGDVMVLNSGKTGFVYATPNSSTYITTEAMTDNAVVRANGTSGTSLQNSVMIISDAGAMSGVTSITGLTTPLTVAQGGTGAATFTDGGILLGSGTSAITALGVLADGSIVVGDGTTDPVALAAFSSSTGNLLAAKGGTIGQQTIWVPAAAMEAAVTTAAATSNAVEIGTSLFAARTMDFATDADDFAYFAIQMPKGWDEGTLVFQFVWSATGQGGGNDSVVWAIAAQAYASDDPLTGAFPAATAATLQEHSATNDDVMITAETSAVTVGGSPAAEEFVAFEVSRDVSEDDLDVDARLHGIKIHYTIDAGTDD